MIRMRKSVAVIITAAVMSFVFSSCSVAKIFNNGQPLNASLSEEELARIITLSVQDKDNVASGFSSIPASQLDSVTYSTFAEYTNILRTMIKGRGAVTAFRVLPDDIKASIFEKVSNACGIDVAETYPNEDLIEIICNDDSDQKVYFPLLRTDNVSLDGKAMSDTIASYNYLFHYMNMVYDLNSAALVSILDPSYTEDIYIDSVMRSKADYVIDYYTKFVSSGYDDIKVSMASPCLVRFNLPKVKNGNGDVFTKDVSIINRNGDFFIDDKMPLNPDNKQIFLFGGSTRAFAVGDTLTMSKVKDTLGEPLFVVSHQDPKSGMERVVVCYNGMDLAFDATFDETGNWNGTLVSIRIFGKGDFTVDNSVYVGMNISELMLIYPFVDEYDYVFEYEDGSGKRTISFELDDLGNIVNILMR